MLAALRCCAACGSPARCDAARAGRKRRDVALLRRAPTCARAPPTRRRVDAATLCLIDRVRAAHHLRPLRSNHELQSGRHRARSTSMVRWRLLRRRAPAGQTPLALVARHAYPAHAARLSVGQNIAWGTGPTRPRPSIVAAWMASPPHRAIILTGEYRDAGVGVTPAVPSARSARGDTPARPTRSSSARGARQLAPRRAWPPSGAARGRLRRPPPRRGRRRRRCRAPASTSARG